MGIKCFLLSPVDKVRVWLRRYTSSAVDACPLKPGQYSYHDNMYLIGDLDYLYSLKGHNGEWAKFEKELTPPNDDTRWPKVCNCGYEFKSTDTHQLFSWQLYSGNPDGSLVTLHDTPVGALWYAMWYKDESTGQWYGDWDNMTGPPLMCKTPGGDWNIDSRASNCTLLADKMHRCWIRHGEPPNIHVDKNGLTCSAGGGSIQSGNWHGFLHNGELV